MRIEAIGTFYSPFADKLEAPRQAVGDVSGYESRIELNPGHNFEQALEDLEGFSHVWVIFQFDRNQTWKTKVQPPRGSTKQRGVFATRSPYRPNSIGISCCELLRIEGRTLFLRQTDLLDGTPILDIKPYVVESDCFPEARQGWIGENKESLQVSESASFTEQATWLCSQGLTSLITTSKQQLEQSPFDRKSKRVRQLTPNKGVFSFRTWRVEFQVRENSLTLEKIFSGYSEQDLSSTEDPFHDKQIHRDFVQHFSTNC